ncbi:MAG: CCA tRNA nucleotidyltransferase [Mangrovicoccus sp.]|nr:CCA tRNA nucleotidyltransferase [Mangrovicoccus sp.]
MLTDAGHQALFVGGCVRNGLLGAPVSDLDISTDARPERVMELAKAAGLKPLPTGIDHGTVTVLANGRPYEITTFRRDVASDGRRAVVAFADRVEEDAARRDFTMNALYADPCGQVLDPLGGMADLRARHLRFIGDPDQRIAEDYLRILRFFRFTAWYGDPGLGIDAEGLAACAAGTDGLAHVSAERLGHEMRRLAAAPDPVPALAAMQASGVLGAVLPGAEAQALGPLVDLEETYGLAPQALRRLALLGGQDMAQRLRLSRAEARQMDLLRDCAAQMRGAAELAFRHGAQLAWDALVIRAAMTGTPLASDVVAQIAQGAAAEFPIKAADLMPALTGPALGKMLERLKADWIASGFALSRQELLRRAGA